MNIDINIIDRVNFYFDIQCRIIVTTMLLQPILQQERKGLFVPDGLEEKRSSGGGGR